MQCSSKLKHSACNSAKCCSNFPCNQKNLKYSRCTESCAYRSDLPSDLVNGHYAVRLKWNRCALNINLCSAHFGVCVCLSLSSALHISRVHLGNFWIFLRYLSRHIICCAHSLKMGITHDAFDERMLRSDCRSWAQHTVINCLINLIAY